MLILIYDLIINNSVVRARSLCVCRLDSFSRQTHDSMCDQFIAFFVTVAIASAFLFAI